MAHDEARCTLRCVGCAGMRDLSETGSTSTPSLGLVLELSPLERRYQVQVPRIPRMIFVVTDIGSSKKLLRPTDGAVPIGRRSGTDIRETGCFRAHLHQRLKLSLDGESHSHVPTRIPARSPSSFQRRGAAVFFCGTAARGRVAAVRSQSLFLLYPPSAGGQPRDSLIVRRAVRSR